MADTLMATGATDEDGRIRGFPIHPFPVDAEQHSPEEHRAEGRVHIGKTHGKAFYRRRMGRMQSGLFA